MLQLTCGYHGLWWWWAGGSCVVLWAGSTLCLVLDSTWACLRHLPLVAFLVVSFGLVQEVYTAPPAYMLVGALSFSRVIGQLLMQQHSCVACAV